MGVVPKIPPSAYVNWYQNIDVWTTAGPVKQASVTRYLCNIAKYGGLGDSPVFWQTILQAANAAKLFYRTDQVAGAFNAVGPTTGCRDWTLKAPFRAPKLADQSSSRRDKPGGDGKTTLRVLAD